MTAKMKNTWLNHWAAEEAKMVSITLFMFSSSHISTVTSATYRQWNNQQQVMFPALIIHKASDMP